MKGWDMFGNRRLLQLRRSSAVVATGREGRLAKRNTSSPCGAKR
jgi:hypothetical protein